MYRITTATILSLEVNSLMYKEISPTLSFFPPCYRNFHAFPRVFFSRLSWGVVLNSSMQETKIKEVRVLTGFPM
jgi:hypothetical protein